VQYLGIGSTPNLDEGNRPAFPQQQRAEPGSGQGARTVNGHSVEPPYRGLPRLCQFGPDGRRKQIILSRSPWKYRRPEKTDGIPSQPLDHEPSPT